MAFTISRPDVVGYVKKRLRLSSSACLLANPAPGALAPRLRLHDDEPQRAERRSGAGHYARRRDNAHEELVNNRLAYVSLSRGRCQVAFITNVRPTLKSDKARVKCTGGDPAGTNSSDDYAFPDVLTGPGCRSLVNPRNPDHYVKTQCCTVPTAPSPAFFSAAAPLGCDPAFGSLNPNDPNYLWCFNLRGNAGRNSLIGPGITNLDFSVFKNNPVRRISENFNIQFRAEFFNILNHANFGDPNVPNTEADLFDATGAPIATVGHLTTTTTDSREIQFALKITW